MEQQLRVVHINNFNRFEGGDIYFVATIEEAKRTIRALAAEELNDNSIIFNAFDLTVKDENDEWETWYDADGKDINNLIDEDEDAEKQSKGIKTPES